MPVKTQYDITYTCGHSDTRDLSAKPAGDRAGLAAWYAKKVCFDCYRKAQGTDGDEIARRREQEAAEAADFATRNDLPTFAGSEKQVAWALRSRHTLIRDAYSTLVESGDATEEQFERTVLAPARLADKPSWWIDNRDQDAADLPELLASVATDENASSCENPN